ncbi:MAG TPA: DUF4402 domain-containing protein [Bacteroidales bacterium]|nr:DUF4402 domain-containing protein [Bacteroidales bacterium]
MKNVTKHLALTILGFAFSIAAFGQNTATATAASSALIYAPIAISSDADMNFGTVVANSTTAGSVLLATTGVRTPTTVTVLASGAGAAAHFNVTGNPSTTFAISFDNATITLTETVSGTETMTVGTFAHDEGATPTLSATGTADFYVGGTLNVGANQAPGLYENASDLSVTVNYN